MESFYLITGVSAAVVDVNGEILMAVGWQEACRNFHRMHQDTEQLCRQSDAYILDKLDFVGEKVQYKCVNGLMHIAAPVFIAGEHVATVFQGQFFSENPDIDYFRKQAQRYSFAEEEYLNAICKVPIYSEEKLHAIMTYFTRLAEMLAEAGLSKLKQIESQADMLKKSDYELIRVFNNIPNIAIQFYDAQGNITFWNNESQNIYGFTSDEVVGKCVNQVFTREVANKVIDIIRELDLTDQPYGPGEWIVQNKEGVKKTIYSTLFPIQLFRGEEFIRMDVDITEKRKFEKEILRLDQLYLIGQMAAGIGHEVRNPMTTVRGYLQMLRNKPSFQSYTSQLDLMIEELDYANQIIKEFLSLAKDKTVHKEMLNLNQIIHVMMPLLYADAIRENKTVEATFGDIPLLLLDEKETRQLLLNLVRNGLEAMDSWGVLRIQTFRENNNVVLVIQDNGKGIAEDVIGKLGTPFFTSKPQGTGLGLAVCYSIAARHQAKITIQSDSSGTTVFTRFMVPAV